MTFLQPFYLIGLAFTAIPIVIHLWFRKKLDKIPFSTLKFLKKSEARRFGWLKLREIIILTLRCLLIAFIFLGLAKPQMEAGFLKPGQLASVILIIDNSYSMVYGDNFDRAIERTEDLLLRYSSKSEFTVFPLCQNEDPVNPGQVFWMRKESVLNHLRKINISHQSGTINGLSPYLFIDQARYPVELIYIGDGQEIVFTDLPRELTTGGNFYWIKIPTGNNVGIQQVSLKDPIAVISDNYILNITVQNYGSDIWQGKVTLQATEYMREQECEIRPGYKEIISLRLPAHLDKGKVQIYDDSLPVDNIYYFSKSLPEKMNILIVGSTRFLESGLDPASKVDGPFALTAVESIGNINLQQFNVIILNGVEEISNNDRIKLETFLIDKNKGIVCFLGQKIGKNLISFIGRCCRAEEYISAKGYVTLDWVDYEHPAFRIFKHTNVLRNIKIHKYHRLNTDNKIIAKSTGNNPFIVIDNNLTVVATQFLPQNTDIVYKTAFVPLVHRLIISTGQRSYDHELYVGDRNFQYGEMKTPTGEYIMPGQRLLKPGFYMGMQDTFGVNVVPIEGNLKTFGSEAAEALRIKIIDIEKDFGQRDMSTIFLLLALFVLLVELLMLIIR